MRFSPTLLTAVGGSPVKLPWRQSAGLMIATRMGNEKKLGFLMMERSKNSRFMPGATVFPGGAISAEDGSKKWCSLFEEAGVNLTGLKILEDTANRPYIYQPGYPQYNANLLPKEITLRITSIREAFEECGVLLCKPMNSFGTSKSIMGVGKPLCTDDSVILEWQEKVRHNPEEFLRMCQKLEMLPDLMALCEWSNWLTPTSMKNRFDAVFFITVVDEARKLYVEKNEAESAEWIALNDIMGENGETTRILQPPQRYELYRMRNIRTVEELMPLIELRRRKGVERWMPVIMNFKDGVASILPGDDLYPRNVNDTDQSEIGFMDMLMEESSRNCKILHRVERSTVKGHVVLRVTGGVKYGHYYSSDGS